jgi:superfamily II DNA/RNA helicase
VPNSTARRAARASKPRHKQPRDGARTNTTRDGHRHNGTDRARHDDRGDARRNDRADSRYGRTADTRDNRYSDRSDSRYSRNGGDRDNRNGDSRDSRYGDSRDNRYGGDRTDRKGGYRGHVTDTRRGYRDEAPARGRKTDRGNSRHDRNDWSAGDQRTNGNRFGNRPFRDDRPARGGYRNERPTADERGGYRNERPNTHGRDSFDRPTTRDRAASHERGGFHNERPSHGRGGFGDERSTTRGRDERPAYGRRGFGDERPANGRYTDRGRSDRAAARPDRDGDWYANRPQRAADRRPAGDRYARTEHTGTEHTGTESPVATDVATDVATEVNRAAVNRGEHWDGQITEDGRRQASVTFAELGLPTPLLHALEAEGITEPFPIQAATLPDALGGRDVLGRAQTGSGKTLAFGLALLTRLHKGKTRPGRPRGIVLVPTRELAMQVTDALMPLAKALGLWCRTVVGGLSFSKQVEQLERGIDLLIATPGRLSDHVRQGTCALDDVRFVALDEADQMADMGFLPQVRAILDLVPAGQRMLFSATLDRDVAALVDNYLTDPVTHSVSPPTATVSTMDHHLLLVSHEDKPAVVAEMAAREGRTIMFLRTKHHVDRLTSQLREMGVRAGALHGGKPQGARNRVLGEFKDGRLPVLVATDVAARGIHVDGVSLVVHVDPPSDAKGYLHRAGRTARAGEAGTVVTLVTHQERRTVFRMTAQAGVQPERTKVRPGDDDLVRITGARTPSGEPVVDPEPTRRPPRSHGRFNRPGGRPRRPR